MLGWLRRRRQRADEARRRNMAAWLLTFDDAYPLEVRMRARQMVLDAAVRDRELAAWIRTAGPGADG